MVTEPSDDAGLPWYLKVVIAILLLVVLFIIVVDLFAFASAL